MEPVLVWPAVRIIPKKWLVNCRLSSMLKRKNHLLWKSRQRTRPKWQLAISVATEARKPGAARKGVKTALVGSTLACVTMKTSPCSLKSSVVSISVE